MRARRILAGATLLAAVAVMSLPAGAAPQLGIGSAVRNGNEATVTGTATFAAVTDAVSVGGTNVNFGRAEAAAVPEQAGINMTDALIQPLANGSGLRFIWQLQNLPDQVPPEGVRYTWAFKIGQRAYQLQAKRTNIASITTAEDPVNHVKQLQAGAYFQLRGACVDQYEGAPTSGCYHLAFLNGGFDAAKDQVFIDLPYQTRDKIGRLVAEDFKPGVMIEENQTAAMSITAAFQAVVGNTTTSDYTNGWNPYFAGKAVQLGVGAPTAKPEAVTYTSSATLSGDSFTGKVAGLTDKNNTVFVRACSALECSYASVLPAAG